MRPRSRSFTDTQGTRQLRFLQAALTIAACFGMNSLAMAAPGKGDTATGPH
jgi:hypothetical protein